eukprot:evm.model.NODE_29940_length_27021_cov_30.846083.4
MTSAPYFAVASSLACTVAAFATVLLLFLLSSSTAVGRRLCTRVCTTSQQLRRRQWHSGQEIKQDKETALFRCDIFHADVILVLGGDRHRELTAVRLFNEEAIVSALALPHHQHESHIHIDYTRTPLILSSGAIGPDDLPSSLPPSLRVTFDRRAVCTLTNFTSLSSSFQAQGVRRVLVLTSSSHLPRALAVGSVVLGAGGMDVRGLGIKGGGGGGQGEEGWLRRGRDYVRAWVWVVFGWEWRGVVAWVHPTRKAEEG